MLIEIDNTLTIYLSGPMAGIPEYNKKGFADAKAKLKKLGYKNVVSPRDLPGIGDPEIESDYMKIIKRDIVVILEKADWVVLIDGWEKSRGANLEIAVAKLLDIPVFKIWELEYYPKDINYEEFKTHFGNLRNKFTIM